MWKSSETMLRDRDLRGGDVHGIMQHYIVNLDICV